MRSFSSADIERITGLKSNTLHYYVQRGAFTPDVRAAEGRGSRRLFSAKNLVEAFLLKWLMNLGLPRSGILEFFRSLGEGYGPNVLDPETVASTPGETVILFYPCPGEQAGFRILTIDGSAHNAGSDLLDHPGYIFINVSWIVRHLVMPRIPVR